MLGIINVSGDELTSAGVIAFATLLILGLAELVRRLGATPELSRKTAHVGSGLVALTLPYLFQSVWLVAAVAAAFLMLIIGTRVIGTLKGVHGIDRESLGAYAFPIVIVLIFWLADGDALMYQIPIGVLAVSDAVAALIGKGYGTMHYRALGEQRSIEGSAAFFFVTFVAVHIPLLLLSDTGRVESVLIAANIAALVTCFEAISVRGLDNFFIPFGTWYALNNFMQYPLDEHWTRSVFIAIFGVLSLVLSRTRILTATGATGFFLCGYAAFSLGGPQWFWPLLATNSVLLAISFALKRSKPDMEPMGLARLFQVCIPAVVVLLYYDDDNQTYLFMPYLGAMCAGAAIVAGSVSAQLGQPSKKMPLVAACIPALSILVYPGHIAVSSPLLLSLAAITGAAAFYLVRGLSGTTARFKCNTCHEITPEVRHCGSPTELESGSRYWTENSLALISIVVTTLMTTLLYTAFLDPTPL